MLFLAGELSAWMTGQVLVVDGGTAHARLTPGSGRYREQQRCVDLLAEQAVLERQVKDPLQIHCLEAPIEGGRLHTSDRRGRRPEAGQHCGRFVPVARQLVDGSADRVGYPGHRFGVRRDPAGLGRKSGDHDPLTGVQAAAERAPVQEAADAAVDECGGKGLRDRRRPDPTRRERFPISPKGIAARRSDR